MQTHETNRDLPEHLNGFIRIVDDAGANITSKKASKGKKKARVADNGVQDDEDRTQKGGSKSFLGRFDLDPSKFYFEVDRAVKMMEGAPFNRPNRTSKRLIERVLVMSGLSWNQESRNKPRDWTGVAISAALETEIIRSYRADMLKTCKSACALRKAFHDYFNDFVTTWYPPVFNGEQSVGVSEWSFADNIPVNVGECDGKGYDSDALKKELQAVHEAVSKDKKHPGAVFVASAEKNLHFRCLKPGVERGTIETFAHFLITGLLYVSVC